MSTRTLQRPPSHRPSGASIASRRFRRRNLVIAGWASGLVLALLVQHPVLDAAGRLVAIRANDGRAIGGLLFEANERPAPAVVLVPMLGRPKDDWQDAAQRLADAGMTALAIDLRSQSLPATPQELSEWHRDIGAAVTYLSSRAEIRGSAIGVAGASLGANLAALAAASDGRIRSLALVSPSLDYRGVRIETAMRQYGARPALLLASLADPYAARSVKALAQDPPGIRDTQWATTPAHGTVLLAREPDAVGRLVDWFRRTLGG